MRDRYGRDLDVLPDDDRTGARIDDDTCLGVGFDENLANLRDESRRP